MPVSEHDIQNLIRIALSANDCTVFRINVGSVKLPNGQYFSSGVPNGFPDLMGFRHMDNKIYFIEVKNAIGKPRKDQIKFHEFLNKNNVIHGIARSADEAVEIVSKGLVGYGFKHENGE